MQRFSPVGSTPLHVALRKGAYGFAELLINWGANVNAVDAVARACIVFVDYELSLA
jgi:ankyrin repeat protein